MFCYLLTWYRHKQNYFELLVGVQSCYSKYGLKCFWWTCFNIIAHLYSFSLLSFIRQYEIKTLLWIFQIQKLDVHLFSMPCNFELWHDCSPNILVINWKRFLCWLNWNSWWSYERSFHFNHNNLQKHRWLNPRNQQTRQSSKSKHLPKVQNN